MGGFSNFAVSFSIISILTGAVLLYGYGLKLAGPIVNTVGWPVVSVFTLAIAASMAELASAYPTAGGLYFWAFRLGGRGWAWTTAWLNMVGQVTITAGINVAAAIYLIGAATRVFGVPGGHAGAGLRIAHELGLPALRDGPSHDPAGRRQHLRRAADGALERPLSVCWHIAGGAVIVLLLLCSASTTTTSPSSSGSSTRSTRSTPPRPTWAAGSRRPWSSAKPGSLSALRLWRRAWRRPTAPRRFGLVFVLALLQAQWTYTGYDASAHMAEETRMARLNSAWGIFLSVAVSAVVGYVLLVVLTWTIPRGDVAAVASDPYPVLAIADGNLARPAAHLVAIIIGGAMWLCGSSSVSSMARMWFAFARDGGMPGSRWIATVTPGPAPRSPRSSSTSALAVLVSLYAAAFTVLTSASTITLYLAYGIPIFLNLRNRLFRQGEFATRETAPWSLGRRATFINVVAVAWVLFITVVFALPPNELVLWTTLLFGLFLAVYWRAYARRHFRGPSSGP